MAIFFNSEVSLIHPCITRIQLSFSLYSCTKLQKYYQAILIMIQVSIAGQSGCICKTATVCSMDELALLAIRTYAMYNGSRKILITLVTAIAIGVGVGIVCNIILFIREILY